MIRILILSALLLVGCGGGGRDLVTTDLNAVKFKIGQKVKCTLAFYSSCTGYVTDVHGVHDLRDPGSLAYAVQFSCGAGREPKKFVAEKYLVAE